MVDLNSSGGQARKIGLSLVVPVLNESESVGPFLARVGPIVEALMRAHGPAIGYEIVFVDDGSTDDTVATLLCAARDEGWVSVVRHHENRGLGAARMGPAGDRPLSADLGA